MASAASVSFISSSSPSSSSSSSLKLHCFSKPFLSLRLQISLSTPKISLKSSLSHFQPLSNKKLGSQVYSSSVEELTVEQQTQENETQEENKKKLYVVNMPYSLSVADIKTLFGQCGTVTDVEIIKQKDGRNKGFAFITMASGEEARAVIDKFNLYEISGRTIRVAFANRLKKPSPPPPTGTRPKETRHLIYVSNLAWKTRASHLRELFSTCSSPVSARVVFDGPSGRSGGYGFVSYATKEEAEAAITALDGKELMGRPVRLKFSEKNVNESGSEPGDESAGGQPEEADDAGVKPEEL